MNRIKLGMILLAAGLFLSQCTSPSSGGGGGLFGGGSSIPSEENTWDLIFMLTGATACSGDVPGQGAGVEGLIPQGPSVPPIGYFPGVKVTESSGQFTGVLPEVKMLTYFEAPAAIVKPPTFTAETPDPELPPSVVQPGDTINVHFIYMTQADGVDGDYFLVRIVDGSRFLVPAAVYGDKMAKGEPVTIDFQYTAQSEGFGLEFIIGLSAASDAVYLDNLKVRVAGELLFEDYFEEGDYTVMQPMSDEVVRAPFLPADMAGTIAVQAATVLRGVQTLAVTGGRAFQLYGQGASGEGFSGLIVNYTATDMLRPFFGQSLAMKQGGMYMGDYFGTDDISTPTCQEQGSVLISVNPQGNADLSGLWTLQVLAECEEGIFIGELTGEPTLYAAVVPVIRYFMVFTGWGPFMSMQGDALNGLMGLSVGNSGMMMLTWGADGQAQLLGNFFQDKETGAYIFAGQIMGSLPWAGMTCTITQGMFTAIIDKSAEVVLTSD